LSFALGAVSQKKFAQLFWELNTIVLREWERKASHDQPWRTEVGVFILHTKKIWVMSCWVGEGKKMGEGTCRGEGVT
jgi:hypothetical protein